MCKYHTLNSKGFTPGNSRVLNSLEPWRGMLRLDSSFPSRPNYATSVGVGGGSELVHFKVLVIISQWKRVLALKGTLSWQGAVKRRSHPVAS